MNKISFIPLSVARAIAPKNGQVIISISDDMSGDVLLHSDWHDVLRLSFDDADTPEAGRLLFNLQLANKVIEFMTKHESVENMVVHCTMGTSRRAAVALFIAEVQNRQLYQQTRPIHSDKPYTQYNRLVYRVLHNTFYKLEYSKNPTLTNTYDGTMAPN